MSRTQILAALGTALAASLAACGSPLDKIEAEDAAPAMAQAYLGSRPIKVLVDPTAPAEAPIYRGLAADRALLREVDYGSFRLLVLDGESPTARQMAAPLPGHREFDQIPLNGYLLDTLRPAETYDTLPRELRRPGVAQAFARDDAPPPGLYLVQFIGPVKDAWLNELRATGARLVSYVPANAYVIQADADAAAQLQGHLREQLHVQFVGSYEPAFRLSPELRALRAQPRTVDVHVTVQVADGPEAQATLAQARALGQAPPGAEARLVAGLWVLPLSLPSSKLAALSQLDGVFTVEERTPRRRLDEVQGQIVAGNLSGNLPSGPGYLSWLTGKGFSSSQFTGFAVNVVDDAYALSGHPDLPAGRIAFQNNPTAQSGAQGGHGFLNAHIVGGFNNSTGSAYTDAGGYHYGLGIAPYARVGVTAIFGGTAATSTAWEDAGYGGGARISTNSWGYTGTAARKYDANAREYDVIVRDSQAAAGAQPMAVVFAAGNDGSGANTVSSPGTAKNVITAGAGENVRQTGSDGCGVPNSGADSANDIISFSSRGPVNSAGGDGRVKPDLIAPGTHIEAGVPQSSYDGSSVCNQYWPSGQTLYGWSSGTSHSCPAVAGGMALVYQHFLNQGRPAPSPAMIKAFLLSSASHMTGVGANDTLPSNNQGMGRMNLGRAFDGVARIYNDQANVLGNTGDTFQVTGNVSSTSQPFRVTLAWTDAPGPTTGAPWVNNLDLEVSVGGTTYKGNVFSGANSASGGTADAKNNVESVFIPAGVSGPFTVTVRATNIAGDGVPGNADTTDQDFALVVYNGVAGTPTQPTISAGPSALSFSATTGGANPANQTISITNSGGGTLTWAASDNAGWLTLSPASGTAPSSLVASVNISGLAAGTYTGAISISATGATNSPLSVPVTLTVSGGGGGTELIQNGGFETSATPWVLSGKATRSTASLPHGGTGYLIEAGANSATGAAYQQIAIPAGASPNLTFWLDVSTSETTTVTQYDRLFVEVRSTAGALLGTLATYSNLSKTAAPGAYVQRGPFSLAAYQGQTVRLQFRATTDSSLVTTFRVDDVSVK
jgi:hypothetical protein